MRISVQLIEAAADRHLWADNFERGLASVLSIQSELAEAIARQIKVRLTSDEAARLAAVRPVDGEAYEAHLHGRAMLHRSTPDSLRTAQTVLSNSLGRRFPLCPRPQRSR